MSLELYPSEVTAISILWGAWERATDTEIEATFKSLDYTSFLNVIKYLRAIGLVEEPQEEKLNIMVAGGLRFTVVGDAAVRAYCRDNSLSGKKFHVIKKTKKMATADGMTEVDLKEYDVRIKIRREQLLDRTNHQVVEALSKWNTLPKSFRYIKRFQFKSSTHEGIVFDASLVRESKKNTAGGYVTSVNFNATQIMRSPMRYEMEVEALRGGKQSSLLIGIATVLRGIQRSYVLVRNSVKKAVQDQLAGQTGVKSGFPGAQPITLLRDHMAEEKSPDTPNIRFDDYNVTDKADGDRCFLIVARDGRLYMIDRNLNVYNTGRRLPEADAVEWSGAILDGEWVTRDREDKPICRYYAFDILYGRRGEDVTGRPFLTRSVDGAEPLLNRHKELTEAVSVLDKAPTTLTKKIPDAHRLSIHAKVFEIVKNPAAEPNGIFNVAASVLERVKRDEDYHTDGLIFTPNASTLPKTGGRWTQQFKWKPAAMNSVDFLVVTEKERGVSGKPTSKELIVPKNREDTNQIVTVKTLRLLVGAATHPALENPRETVLLEKPFPKPSELRSNYRPVEFAPQPPDPMGAVCYVAINAGATDAAGAAPEAQVLASYDESIYAENGDPINDRTIVEMVYDVKAPAGWRWKPIRVRWDKTEKFARGEISGTLNSDGNANDVWQSIHNPITEKMICTGETTDDTLVEGATDTSAVAYYQRRAPQRDLAKITTLVDFHNNYIKQMLITRALLNKGMSLLDMSCGQAGDLHRWVEHEPSWVLGCDIAEAGLADPKNGAYSRYLNKMIRARGAIPPMLFIQADSSKNYTDGSAGATPVDRAMLRVLWGDEDPLAPPAALRLAGKAALGFDSAECMFSLHYFFKDRPTLDGFMANLARTVKVNGLFVGCCFDGDAVAGLLKDYDIGGTERGVDGGTELWTITKQYDDKTGIVPPSDEGLGRAIDVNFISIGEAYREYLVSFPFLVEQMKAIGFELLTEEECGEMGLYNSTNMFGDSHAMAASLGRAYPMLPVVQKFSFLNRWFIFRRRRTTGLAVMPSVRRLPVAAPVVAEEAPVVVEEVVEAPSPVLEAEVPDSESASGAESNAGELAIADGPIYLFSHKSARAKRDELKAIGIKDKYWRRYISTVAPFNYKDRMDPSIVYPNLEAALASAKLQVASKRPELGPQLFSVTGNLHQELVPEITAAGTDEDVLFDLAEREVKGIFAALKPKALKEVGVKKIEGEAWAAQQEEILVDYVRQRFEGDVKFQTILAALGAQKARLVYSYAASGDLAGGVEDETITGPNLYGRALMRTVGLTYE
jgi:SAM-dependent methyltransferase